MIHRLSKRYMTWTKIDTAIFVLRERNRSFTAIMNSTVLNPIAPGPGLASRVCRQPYHEPGTVAEI